MDCYWVAAPVKCAVHISNDDAHVTSGRKKKEEEEETQPRTYKQRMASKQTSIPVGVPTGAA